MSIETTLTLAIAGGLLVGALVIRTVVMGLVRLGTFAVQWARPSPARHSTRTYYPNRTATRTTAVVDRRPFPS